MMHDTKIMNEAGRDDNECRQSSPGARRAGPVGRWGPGLARHRAIQSITRGALGGEGIFSGALCVSPCGPPSSLVRPRLVARPEVPAALVCPLILSNWPTAPPRRRRHSSSGLHLARRVITNTTTSAVGGPCCPDSGRPGSFGRAPGGRFRALATWARILGAHVSGVGAWLDANLVPARAWSCGGGAAWRALIMLRPARSPADQCN